jgi:hypothetical protein
MTNRIEIIDEPGDAEDADGVVCMRLTSPLLLPDNVIDICSKCGEAIQYRPNAPKRPPKLCYVCADPIITDRAAKGDLTATMTRKTMAEVADYYRKKNAH